MESEQSQNFNERLSEWVANQGFWFQVRYSLTGSGTRGLAMFHLLKLTSRLLIFLLVVALGIWIYLLKRSDTAGFADGLQSALESGLEASDLELEFNRTQGQLELTRLAAEGGNDTFFTVLEARNVRCSMNLLDGLVGIWNPGVILISQLDVDLRAGTDDAESARKLAGVVFRKPEKTEANAYEVRDATVRWGYSARTQGMIESSVMRMYRTDTGWRMSFKGGRFHQNWLRGLEIVELVVLCEPEGMVFETAELKLGDGTVDFSGLKVIGGERPEVRGVARIRSLPLDGTLPVALTRFIEGSVSGDFRVFGSTNSSDGIGFEGQVVMDGMDTISLRERIHLLKALSVVDYSRTYHRIDFREGSFQLKTLRGGVELTDVNLKADDLFSMEGSLTVRLPTQEEIEAAVARGSGLQGSALFADEDETFGLRDFTQTKSEFSLKRAALEAKRIQKGNQSPESLSLGDRLGLNNEMRRLQSQASDRMSRMLQYEGMFRITIPPDAFERAARLQEMYPVDAASNRIPVPVPIEGGLYDLTLKQAEDIYQQGRR